MAKPPLHVRLTRPEDVIPALGRGAAHWKKGRSAYETAHAWFAAAGELPPAIAAVLARDPVLAGAQLVDAFLERETAFDSHGRPSQTDVLAVLRLRAGGLAVLGVEAKVDETFGPRVAEWRDGSPGKEARLTGLLARFGVTPQAAEGLRYQLFHRTAATLVEAARYATPEAVMLVHSFSPAHAWFEDFAAFAAAVGAPVAAPGEVSAPLDCAGVRLRLGWAADRPA